MTVSHLRIQAEARPKGFDTSPDRQYHTHNMCYWQNGHVQVNQLYSVREVNASLQLQTDYLP